MKQKPALIQRAGRALKLRNLFAVPVNPGGKKTPAVWGREKKKKKLRPGQVCPTGEASRSVSRVIYKMGHELRIGAAI